MTSTCPMSASAKPLKRSACDPCRAKRVRCLRPQDSMASCARCSYLGSPCVTGAAGQPGRPPKRARRSPAEGVRPSPPTPAASDEQQQPAVANDADAWAALALGDSATFFGPLVDDSTTGPGTSTSTSDADPCHPLPLPLPQLPPLPPHGLARTDSASDLTAPDLQTTSSSSIASSAFALDMDLLWDGDMDLGDAGAPGHAVALYPPYRLRQPPSVNAARSLAALRDEIDQRIGSVDTYYADPVAVHHWCTIDNGQEGADSNVPEHPPAALLTCSKKLIDILHVLATTAGASSGASSGASPGASPGAALPTEVLLLALSTYLALLRLFDVLFHRTHETIRKLARLPGPIMPLDCVQVKSVLRIGGVATLQDMPLKAYAAGLLEAIYAQMQSVERCLGVPRDHCLRPGPDDDGELAVAPGLFSRADRAQLFATVMAQDDVRSRRDGKSYVESIRANIDDCLAFFKDSPAAGT
ncbi:hypothetical protein HMPREF1624_02304 [Sporothrix schenckii ATCC 58251]|uniref:Zn(2)-C6 fungal-type domain-containing protein n=1 Tax=Sporothrix schenckii (strain ATCC 58251 / de Perez 2211183) TaxID=1391915 RepID=U7Q1L6_SPOS1|nr:hypothetical protein HMPREF1624_02304 [Sporothrix schenckii ATCC 58251]